MRLNVPRAARHVIAFAFVLAVAAAGCGLDGSRDTTTRVSTETPTATAAPDPTTSTTADPSVVLEYLTAVDEATTTTTAPPPPSTTTTSPPSTEAPAPAPAPAAPQASAPSTGACWDCLAQCEAGGNWAHPPVGSYGYSGGLMFLPSTWAAYGGLDYAPAAWQASRSAQIAVAERILADVGRGAWPGCSAAGAW